CGDLELVGGLLALGAGDAHAVFTVLDDADIAKVTDDVGQNVGFGIADLIDQLLRGGEAVYQPARALGLREDEVARRLDLDDGVADVFPAVDLVPVGIESACRLGAAFDDVARETSAGQVIKIIVLPAEGMNAGPQGHRAVHTAAGDDNIRAHVQGLCHGKGAQVGVDAHEGVWHGFA